MLPIRSQGTTSHDHPPTLTMESSVFSIISTLLVIIPLILLIKMLCVRSNKEGSPVKLPPGPWKLPIIGSLLHLIGEHPHHRLTRLAKIYGPLLHLKLGEIDLITISSPELACEVMKTQDVTFALRPQLVVGEIMFYNNSDIIFSPYGKYWRQLRKICAMSSLNPTRVKSSSFISEEETNNLVEQIRTAATIGEPVNLSKLFYALSNSTIARAVFGKDFAHKERFFLAMKVIVKLGSGFNIADVFPSMGFLGKITGLSARLMKAHKDLDLILNEIIEEHRGRMKERDDEEEENIVDALLKMKESGDLEVPLTIDNIKAVIVCLFAAGSPTSASFAGWTMTELIRHPKAMQEAQLEVKKAFNGKTKIDENNINELKYLNCVIKETFRLHPPAPLLVPRSCSETVKLSGYTIPARSRILINAGAIMKDPKYWENPESFCPERFQGSTLKLKGTNLEYFPFGSGRRICPGMTFALVNIEEWLTQLLLNFDWSMPDGKMPEDLDLEEIFAATISRKNDLCLLATPRK